MNRIALTCLLAVAASGCGNLRAIHYGTELAGGQRGHFIDAQQRAIISADSVGAGEPPITCAEPSPDAISALSAAASANLSNEDLGQLQASFAMSESAANIGLRTPTIQLLRDGMYRLCESYMNGALERGNYLVLINRYQQMMIGLVAIEQLTGTVRAANVQIGGQEAFASSTANLLTFAERSLVRYETRRDEIDVRLQQLDATPIPDTSGENPSAQATADAAERTAERGRLEAERAIVQEAWQKQTDHLVALSQLQAQTLARVAEASVSAAPDQPDGAPRQDPPLSGDNLAAVASAVEEITKDITRNNLREFACMPSYYYGNTAETLTDSQFDELMNRCLNLVTTADQ